MLLAEATMSSVSTGRSKALSWVTNRWIICTLALACPEDGRTPRNREELPTARKKLHSRGEGGSMREGGKFKYAGRPDSVRG